MRPLIPMLALAAAASAARADAVDELCLESEAATPELCACATERFAANVGERDYAFYEAVGARFAQERLGRPNRAVAWSAALRAEALERGLDEAEATTRANQLGSAHRAAIRACR